MGDFNGRRYFDGRASDPNELHWMRGMPPPTDNRITFERCGTRSRGWDVGFGTPVKIAECPPSEPQASRLDV